MSLRELRRLYQLPEGSFFLFGLRGVGKSTWIRSKLPHAVRFDLLDEGLYQELLADPEPFAGALRRLDPESWVVVDEIQRLPGLLNEVHRFIEERGLRFALLGSSARKLRAAGVNLLGGRALWREMFPLTPEELGDEFDLDRTLEIGALPLVLASDSPQETLRAYVQLYLREEIKGEALVRNLPGFARFLPVVGLFHGQLVNVSGIARDAGVARTTVEGYLGVLEDTLLVRRLPAYEARLRVRERKHPKLYWVDPGVARAAKRAYGAVAQEEAGHLLEGWVHTLLCTYMAERELAEEVAYWAPAESGKLEVDFLLRRGSELCAIEVKSARRTDPGQLAGLRAIAELPGLRRRILVHRGARPTRTEDGIDVWPVETLLEALTEDRLWP
ncbi:MAG TPA: ATP-binding protein [Solirubrobacterales bacterium]|nr:ATP-binding protein [Solirubrobacterales bacterium]